MADLCLPSSDFLLSDFLLMLVFMLNKLIPHQFLSLSLSLSLSPSLSLTHRSNGSILHNLIVASQHPNVGYTLNNVTSHVLYKIIHYFMENPINGSTVLKYPVPDAEVRNDVTYTDGGGRE